nr:diterpene synthase class II [Scutellaria barbata]
MYILSAQPIKFSNGFGCIPLSSAARRRIFQESCSRFGSFSMKFLASPLNQNLVRHVSTPNAALNEIKYGLEIPWYAILPRVEARFFIDHCSLDQLWLGNSLHRMPDNNNATDLELAKLDYNRCQTQHQMEWNLMQQWYEEYSVEEFGISQKEVLAAYFLAAASIFETERSVERVAWVKSQILFDILSNYYFTKEAAESEDQRFHGKGYKNVRKIIVILFETLNQLKKDAQEKIGSDVGYLLIEAWGGWLKNLGEGAEEREEVEVIVRTINICGGHLASKEILSHTEYRTLSALTNKICHHLQRLQNDKMIKKRKSEMYVEIDEEMRFLLQLVNEESSNGTISKGIKQTFLVVAKAFYYRAYFSTEQIENHTAKVLFEQLV